MPRGGTLTIETQNRPGHQVELKVREAQNAGEALVMPRLHAGRTARAEPGGVEGGVHERADDPVQMQGVLQAGAVFIPKPVVPAVLQRLIREVLDAPGAPR
jgi:hypothetical protein